MGYSLPGHQSKVLGSDELIHGKGLLQHHAFTCRDRSGHGSEGGEEGLQGELAGDPGLW